MLLPPPLLLLRPPLVQLDDVLSPDFLHMFKRADLRSGLFVRVRRRAFYGHAFCAREAFLFFCGSDSGSRLRFVMFTCTSPDVIYTISR